MTFCRCGMDIGRSNARSASYWPAWQLPKVRTIGLLTLMVSLATAVYCQNGLSGATQSPNSPDCTDPLLATSSQCSGQNQSDSNGTFNLQARPSQSPSPAN